MAEPSFKLPGVTDRLAVMGHTGSGKTYFAAFVLSHMPFHRMPYVIIDYKYDDLLNSVPYVNEIGYNDTPKHPGLYIIHPRPDEDDHVEKFLWKIWERGRTGVYIDESYMIPDSGAYRSLLTQGRSKHIPMINLTQRPRDISRFVFTESDYYSVFHLQDKLDRKRVMEFVPSNLEKRLPPFHSWYHSVKNQATFGLLPVPDGDSILDRFERRLAPKRRLL